MDSSYPHNYGRFGNSHYYNVNGVGLKGLETQLIQYNVRLQNMTNEEELCSTKPIFHPEEDVSVDTLRNFEVNEGENEMKIDVISDKPEKPQIESEEDQTSGIFYTADTFVLDNPDAIDSFVLEVSNDLLNLKEGMHASLPKYVDAPFIVDISKGQGVT
ncbi:hypothetical protein Scep_012095 [Stephania cephalantha]|uniref:Uncharacterized protein n=1 Tax=Stephania cephalantha TaxID=152367 RepID=A0AAP0JET1_9MAGN